MSTYQPWLQPPPPPANGPYGYSPYPYGGFDPNANNRKGNGPDTSQMGYAPSGNEADVNPNASMEDIYAANRDTINTTGNGLEQEGGNQLNYYGGQAVADQTAQNQALNQLQQTPGYTAPIASQINQDYSQFNSTPAQFAAIQGDPNAPVATSNVGVANEQNAEAQYGQNLSSQINQTEGWQGDAATQYGAGVNGAASGLSTGLNSAQGKFAPLDTAVNNSQLGFDPNNTEKQLSDSDVNDLVTSAGTTVGNQFGTAEDTLERQAAAQGNTSPAAQAALRQNLITQEAATAGDTMTNARIAANQAQATRAQSIEQQREGAVDTQTGLQATAATTEEAAAQAAAGQAGQSNIAAQESIGANTQNTANNVSNQALTAANNYGQFDVGQQNTQTGQNYSAAQTAENEGSTRAAQTATMQNQQGVTAATDTATGAKTVGDATIAGQGAYRSGVAGQQSLNQQGAATGQNTQTAAYGTATTGANTAAAGQGNFEVGKPSFGDSLGKGIAGAVAGLFADGGTAEYDGQLAKIAERGEPEMVIPAGGNNAIQMEGVYGSSRKKRNADDELRMAA